MAQVVKRDMTAIISILIKTLHFITPEDLTYIINIGLYASLFVNIIEYDPSFSRNELKF